MQYSAPQTHRVFLHTIVPVWREPEKIRSIFQVKRLEPKRIIGREAQGYSFNYEGPHTVWVWNDIPLYAEDHLEGRPTSMIEAKSLEVDVPIPPEKFQVPATVKLRK
jgi:hypothetical protein